MLFHRLSSTLCLNRMTRPTCPGWMYRGRAESFHVSIALDGCCCSWTRQRRTSEKPMGEVRGGPSQEIHRAKLSNERAEDISSTHTMGAAFPLGSLPCSPSAVWEQPLAGNLPRGASQAVSVSPDAISGVAHERAGLFLAVLVLELGSPSPGSRQGPFSWLFCKVKKMMQA